MTLSSVVWPFSGGTWHLDTWHVHLEIVWLITYNFDISVKYTRVTIFSNV